MTSVTKHDDENWFDPDIAAMQLEYGEKAGLQIYRNYTRAFEGRAIQNFVEVINREALDLTDLQRLVDLIIREDARFLPVIVCAFADDLLKETFRAIIPDGVPGGKENMLGAYGPIADLSKRIKLAYAFDVLSPDLMTELDRLRSARNAISHSWSIDSLSDFFTSGRLTDMTRIEDASSGDSRFAAELPDGFKPLAAFRIRLVWIVGRLVYEAAAYNRAKQARVRPAQALYDKPAPKWLMEIADISLEATRKIAKRDPLERSHTPPTE